MSTATDPTTEKVFRRTFGTEIDLRLEPLPASDLKRLIKRSIEKKASAVHTVWLHGCQIDTAGAKHLATTLARKTCKLTALSLSDNSITDSGAILLARAVRKNKTSVLEYLSLRDNPVSRHSMAELAAMLASNRTLQEVSLQDNDIGDAGAALLVEVLAAPEAALQSLNLTKTGLTDATAARIGAMLRTNTQLLKLYLPGNTITAAGAEAMVVHVAGHPTLKMLSLPVELEAWWAERKITMSREVRKVVSCD